MMRNLLEGAMKGMAEAVGDPYTVYMDKDEFKRLWNQAKEAFME